MNCYVRHANHCCLPAGLRADYRRCRDDYPSPCGCRPTIHGCGVRSEDTTPNCCTILHTSLVRTTPNILSRASTIHHTNLYTNQGRTKKRRTDRTIHSSYAIPNPRRGRRNKCRSSPNRRGWLPLRNQEHGSERCATCRVRRSPPRLSIPRCHPQRCWNSCCLVLYGDCSRPHRGGLCVLHTSYHSQWRHWMFPDSHSLSYSCWSSEEPTAAAFSLRERNIHRPGQSPCRSPSWLQVRTEGSVSFSCQSYFCFVVYFAVNASLSLRRVKKGKVNPRGNILYAYSFKPASIQHIQSSIRRSPTAGMKSGSRLLAR